MVHSGNGILTIIITMNATTSVITGMNYDFHKLYMGLCPLSIESETHCFVMTIIITG